MPGRRRPDVRSSEQEFGVLRRVDPDEREDGRVRHSTSRSEHVGDLYRQLDCHPGVVQARLGSIHWFVIILII